MEQQQNNQFNTFLSILKIIALNITILLLGYITRLNIKNIQNINEYILIKDTITNTATYKDELIELHNIVSVNKNVEIYQWIENEIITKKTGKRQITYKKQWIKNPVDSTSFNDATKNNNCTNKNIYKSKQFTINKITTDNNYIIEQQDFYNKIQHSPLHLKKDSVYYGLPIKKQIQIQKEESYTDLDSYVSSIDNKTAHIEKDKFIVINEGVLFNGSNYLNPQICDTKITYKIFKPNTVTFFGNANNDILKTNSKFSMLDFSNKNINIIITIKKIIFLIMLIVVVNIIALCIKFLLQTFKKIQKFTLTYIPFFNEYFIYSNKIYLDTIYITSTVLFIIAGYYILAPIPIIPLIIARQFDYYSI